MKLFNSKYWHFNVAAWCYFAISAIVTASLVVGPFVAHLDLTRSKLIVGIVLVIASLSLGMWLKCIYLQIAKPNRFAFSCSIAVFLLFGGVSKNYLGLIIFGIPLLLIALGFRNIKLSKNNDAQN